MGSRLDFDSISRADFDDTLAQYPDTVPSKLADLEEQRLTIIPSKLSERKTKGKGHLTKDEVATLVDWKLSHGTFRPSLKGLIQQNSEEFVEETTEAGFSADSLDDSLNTLTKLKGIGPATAALLLSTSEPAKVPFFSDELFRWAFWEDKAGGRWDRKIKYSLKEYRELTARIDALRQRLNVSALEAEKVAYVLGKKGTQLGETVKSPQSPKDTVADAKPPLAKRKATKEPVDDEKPITQASAKKQKGTATTFSRRATRSSTKKERSSE